MPTLVGRLHIVSCIHKGREDRNWSPAFTELFPRRAGPEVTRKGKCSKVNFALLFQADRQIPDSQHRCPHSSRAMLKDVVAI